MLKRHFLISIVYNANSKIYNRKIVKIVNHKPPKDIRPAVKLPEMTKLVVTDPAVDVSMFPATLRISLLSRWSSQNICPKSTTMAKSRLQCEISGEKLRYFQMLHRHDPRSWKNAKRNWSEMLSSLSLGSRYRSSRFQAMINLLCTQFTILLCHPKIALSIILNQFHPTREPVSKGATTAYTPRIKIIFGKPSSDQDIHW